MGRRELGEIQGDELLSHLGWGQWWVWFDAPEGVKEGEADGRQR